MGRTEEDDIIYKLSIAENKVLVEELISTVIQNQKNPNNFLERKINFCKSEILRRLSL